MFRFLILLLLSFSAKAQEVYKTPSGAKYHKADCRMVKNVSEKVTLQQATKMGLGPCKICAPTSMTSQNIKSKITQGESKTVQCSGFTKAGNRCRHMTAIGNGYCFQHRS